jgi:hypothetical protein
MDMWTGRVLSSAGVVFEGVAKAQKSITCVPCVLITVIFCEADRATAADDRAGTVCLVLRL